MSYLNTTLKMSFMSQLPLGLLKLPLGNTGMVSSPKEARITGISSLSRILHILINFKLLELFHLPNLGLV